MKKFIFSIKLELFARIIDTVLVQMAGKREKYHYSEYSKSYHLGVFNLLRLQWLFFLFSLQLFFVKVVLYILDIFPSNFSLAFLLLLARIKERFNKALRDRVL